MHFGDFLRYCRRGDLRSIWTVQRTEDEDGTYREATDTELWNDGKLPKINLSFLKRN